MISGIDSHYAQPVGQLLRKGPLKVSEFKFWPNYKALGIGEAQTPDLIRLALDAHWSEYAPDSAESWGPVHAICALGQLRAEAAAEPLAKLFAREEEPVLSALILFYERIGSAAIPALAHALAQADWEDMGRIKLQEALKHLAETAPDAREACQNVLRVQLEQFSENAPLLNAYLIGNLMDLGYTEGVSLFEQAFAAGVVDTEYLGDWETFQMDNGFKSPSPEYLERQKEVEAMLDQLQHSYASRANQSTAEPLTREQKARRAKAKQKSIKAARKRNRK